MNDAALIELERKKEKLLAGKIEYLNASGEDFKLGYTQDDVKKCDNILADFIVSLQKLSRGAGQGKILKCVKNVVLELNKLNTGTNGCLIEAKELRDFILCAARHSGLDNVKGDITKEWREW